MASILWSEMTFPTTIITSAFQPAGRGKGKGSLCSFSLCKCPRICTHHFSPLVGQNLVTRLHLRESGKCRCSAAMCPAKSSVIIEEKVHIGRQKSSHWPRTPSSVTLWVAIWVVLPKLGGTERKLHFHPVVTFPSIKWSLSRSLQTIWEGRLKLGTKRRPQAKDSRKYRGRGERNSLMSCLKRPVGDEATEKSHVFVAGSLYSGRFLWAGISIWKTNQQQQKSKHVILVV